MFGMRSFVCGVAVLLCATTVFGAQYIISASFTETRTALPNATLSGTLYYLYDSSTPKNSRLRFDYKLPNGMSIGNLYHYTDGALYSMCTAKCTGIKKGELPDPWYATSIYTKTSEHEGSYYWYNRASATNAQVKRILMTDSSAPTASGYTVSKVEFVDGRKLTLTNFKYAPSGISASDSRFARGSNCPSPTCPIFADIVFVLDYSGSVSSGEWKQGADFVIAVMNSFTFGDDGVAAAALMFNGYGANNCNTRDVGGWCYRYTRDCSWGINTIPNANSAQMLAPSTITVSTDKASLINVLSKTRYPSGQTCQGFGMELAQQVLANSPRRKQAIAAGKVPPQAIVIAVTDGVDFCPNRTKKGADDLRSKYGAMVVEIGVGLDTCGNNYDVNFLKTVASKLGSTPQYYGVGDYNKIYQITEQLFKPICDSYYTTDCPNCKGFCGCGSCYCPGCQATGSTCHENTCRESGGTSTGCETKEIPCKGYDVNVCQWYSCDGKKTDAQGRCSVVKNNCESMRKQYPGTCREVKCSTSVNGGCYVELNNAVCKSAHGNACEEFECTPLNAAVPAAYAATGCRLKNNLTANLEATLKGDGRINCFKATCNKVTGVTTPQDTCVSSRPSCATSACTKSGSAWSCKETEVNDPKDACTTYSCTKTGWTVTDQVTRERCIAQFGGEDKVKCGNVFCDAKKGCQNVTIAGCESQCTNEKTAACVKEGYAKSTDSACILGACNVKHTTGTEYELVCNFEDVHDCLKEKEAEVKKLNDAHPDRCYSPICGEDGRCTYSYDDLPNLASEPETKCMHHVCQKANNGVWGWVYVATEENNTCKTDECSYRECLPDVGCKETDICLNRTTDCMAYSCKVDKCVGESLLIRTNCTVEICVDDKKVLTEDLTICSKNNTNMCLLPTCIYDANTTTSYCSYYDKPTDNDDPCLNHTCDPKTGKFTHVFKCDDGLYCTDNRCTVDGTCRYDEIRCSEELDMEGFACFEARCKEDRDNKKHVCMRKLIKDAYVDVCGNCIKEEVNDVAESEMSSSLSHSSIDLLECTHAPPKPILTEGLAAASIALIILFAILIGAGIAASGVIGTKTLIERAKGANNQSAHTNPLFEGNEAEMTNPAFVGETM